MHSRVISVEELPDAAMKEGKVRVRTPLENKAQIIS